MNKSVFDIFVCGSFEFDRDTTNTFKCIKYYKTKEEAEEVASRIPHSVVREYPLGKILPIAGCYEFADPVLSWEPWEYFDY